MGAEEHSMQAGLPRTVLVAACAAILATYALLHGVYRPRNADDAWYLSYVYDYLHKGVGYDVVWGEGVDDGRWMGVELFGKTHAFVYGGILDRAGWTKSHAHLISTVFILAAAWCWYRLLPRLGFGRLFAECAGLAILYMEPFFGAANQARPDAQVFFLASLSLLAFAHGMPSLAGVAAAVALETHPMGIAAFFYVAAAVLWRLTTPPRELRLVLGQAAAFGATAAVVGGVYYGLLHADTVPHLLSEIRHGNADAPGSGNMLTEYFFKTRYWRHLPELVALLLASGVAAWKRTYRDQPFVWMLLPLSLAMLLLVRRPSFMYMVYLYPSFVLLWLHALDRLGRIRWAVALLLLYLLPQYAFAWSLNRGHDLNGYLRRVARAVPDDDITVVGSANDWFAFKHRTFYAIDYKGALERLNLDRFYLIEDEDYRQGLYPRMRRFAEAGRSSVEVARFAYGGQTFVVRRTEAPGPSGP